MELTDMYDECSAQLSLDSDPVAQPRRAPRVALHAEIGIDDDTNFYTGFTENVSEGGLFVATYDLRPVGTEVALTFVLPDERAVFVHGVVRWLRDPRDATLQPGMGIEFVALSPQDQATIEDYVHSRTPLFYPD